ncbi:MAG: tyrosine-type recombinase/integrase [Pseudonocardiaceae bacterium]
MISSEGATRRRKAARKANGSGTIKKRKDGRYEGQIFVRTTSGEFKRISVYGRSWEECDKKITRLKSDNYAGVGASVSSYTVAQWLSYWLEDVVKPARKPSTYVGYEVAVRLYLAPQLGKIKLTALKTADVRGMLNRVRQQCQCCAQKWDGKRPVIKRRCCSVGNCCQRVPNPARVHHVFRTLRAALGVAVAEEVLIRNVASFAKPTRPRRHRFKTWSVTEATTFLAAIREHRLYALFAVAIALGMRRGEALGLRWEDVDLVNGTMTMAMQLQRVAGKLRHNETKTDDSTRVVALPRPCVQALRRHRAQQGAERLAAGDRWTDSGLVFTTRKGTPIEPRNINRTFDALIAKIGITRIRFHDLRHSCATLLYAQGVDLQTIRDLLGHSSIGVTSAIYVDVLREVQRDAVDRLGHLFGPNDQTDT